MFSFEISHLLPITQTLEILFFSFLFIFKSLKSIILKSINKINRNKNPINNSKQKLQLQTCHAASGNVSIFGRPCSFSYSPSHISFDESTRIWVSFHSNFSVLVRSMVILIRSMALFFLYIFN